VRDGVGDSRGNVPISLPQSDRRVHQGRCRSVPLRVFRRARA